MEWFVPIHVIGALAFAVGVFAFRRGITQSGILSGGVSRIVVGALAVTAVTRFVPISAAQFYVQGVAAVVAMWPLAFALWSLPMQPAEAHRDRVALGDQR